MNTLLFLSCITYTVALPYSTLPQATSYIFRSDNNGPASLITLGGPQRLWTPHLPLPGPIQHVPIPAPLPYVAQPVHEIILEEKGNDVEEEEESAHGDADDKGFNSQDEHDDADSGSYSNEDEESSESDEEGDHGKHYSEEDAHGEHSEESGEHGAEKHGFEKGFDNGNDVTGYHKVFHKDEYKKDHDFYDVADKNGNFHKHGYAKEHHGSEEGAHGEDKHSDSGKDGSQFSKQEEILKADDVEEDSDHDAEEGEDSHYDSEEEQAKQSEQDGPYHAYEYEN